jgi:hypothetical protein
MNQGAAAANSDSGAATATYGERPAEAATIVNLSDLSAPELAAVRDVLTRMQQAADGQPGAYGDDQRWVAVERVGDQIRVVEYEADGESTQIGEAAGVVVNQYTVTADYSHVGNGTGQGVNNEDLRIDGLAPTTHGAPTSYVLRDLHTRVDGLTVTIDGGGTDIGGTDIGAVERGSESFTLSTPIPLPANLAPNGPAATLITAAPRDIGQTAENIEAASRRPDWPKDANGSPWHPNRDQVIMLEDGTSRPAGHDYRPEDVKTAERSMHEYCERLGVALLGDDALASYLQSRVVLRGQTENGTEGVRLTQWYTIRVGLDGQHHDSRVYGALGATWLSDVYEGLRDRQVAAAREVVGQLRAMKEPQAGEDAVAFSRNQAAFQSEARRLWGEVGRYDGLVTAMSALVVEYREEVLNSGGPLSGELPGLQAAGQANATQAAVDRLNASQRPGEPPITPPAAQEA